MVRTIVSWAAVLAAGVAGAAERPNVVVFFVDDLGWADVGCYGSTLHETPHIDGLAASGLRFTEAYAAASICSPTRASLMTGKHPVRVGITDWIPGAGDQGKDYPHYHGSMWRPGGAVRSGKWKLVEFFETGAVELYDLEVDPGERVDLVNREKQVAEEMWLKLKDWQEESGAKLPTRR